MCIRDTFFFCFFDFFFLAVKVGTEHEFPAATLAVWAVARRADRAGTVSNCWRRLVRASDETLGE